MEFNTSNVRTGISTAALYPMLAPTIFTVYFVVYDRGRVEGSGVCVTSAFAIQVLDIVDV
jgi:hypothetical protein